MATFLCYAQKNQPMPDIYRSLKEHQNIGKERLSFLQHQLKNVLSGAQLADGILGRRAVQQQRAAGRFCALEDDVFHLLYVDAVGTQAVQNPRQHTHTVVMAHHQMVRGR